MTLVLGTCIGEEAFWATDTLVHYPMDNMFRYKRKYAIFNDLHLVIFPRGSEILSNIWIEDFIKNIGDQPLSDFFSERCENIFRLFIPTYDNHISNFPNCKLSEFEYTQLTKLELIHCFYDKRYGQRSIMVNNTIGNDITIEDIGKNGYFSTPHLDNRLHVKTFNENYIKDILIPSVKHIKHIEDSSSFTPKAFIGGNLEVIRFLGSSIEELGTQYEFQNTYIN